MAGSKNNWQEGQLKNGEEPGQSFVWRFAHIPMDDKSRAKGFTSLEDLFGYLQGQLIQGRDRHKTNKQLRVQTAGMKSLIPMFGGNNFGLPQIIY